MKGNGIGLVVAVALVFLFSGVVWGQVDPNLVGWWQLDDGSGVTAVDSAGSADGTLINGPVWSSGLIGGALEFDGDNDYVDVPALTGAGVSDAVTVSGWVRPNALPGAGNLVAIYNHDAWAAGLVHFQFSGDKLLLAVNSGGDYLLSDSTFSPGQWYHVAAVYEADVNGAAEPNGVKSIYINGVLDVSLDVTVSTQVNLAQAGSIGSWGGTTRFFDGLIDDLRIYDRVLSDEEILALSIPWAGGGTASDPYQIGTKAELLYLAKSTQYYDKYFILTAEIDLAGESFTTAVIRPDVTIGGSFDGTEFTGSFDGDGHVIRNLTIDTGGINN